MKNEEIQFNFQKINFNEKTKNDNIFLSKKHFKSKSSLIYEDFEDGLNVSEIENNEDDNKYLKKTNNYNSNNNNINIDEDFSEDLDNSNESELTSRKFSDSIHIDFMNDKNSNNEKKLKKRKTKEDLNNTPLPLFDCIYCTNEKIVFSNFINNSLSDKYLFLTSIYDMNDLSRLISYQPLIDKNAKNNNKLLNLIIKNTEYINQFIIKQNNIIYFKSNLFMDLCEQYKTEYQRVIKQKIEDTLVRKKIDFYFKGINIISKNSVNNKCLFNSTNSLINYYSALSGLVEPQNLIYIKNNCTIGSGSNNSINFNSLSSNNNDNNKDNNNLLEYIVEKIEKKDESANYAEDKDEIMDFFKFELVRKISKNDIKWENKYYDIYNPEISFDGNEEIIQDNNNYNLKFNNKNKIANNNKLFCNVTKAEIRYNKFQYDNHLFKNSFKTSNKFNDNKSLLEKTIKNHYALRDSKNNTTFIKDMNYNINKSQGIKNILNPKYGISFIKSFNSSSTIDNSYNNNKNSMIGSRSKYKIYENKYKNKIKNIKYNSTHKKIDYNNKSSKNTTNYSIGVSIPCKLNTSFKSNNFIKYNYANTGNYFKKKNNIIYDYKLKNKPNRNNNHKNSINGSSYYQNKSFTYKNKPYNSKSNNNKKKKNKLYKNCNISYLNYNKSNFYNNYNKKDNNKNCKSQNKNTNKNYYIDYNFVDSKENKSLLYNNSNKNCLKENNNPSKSGYYFTSNKLLKNNNNNNNSNNNKKIHHNKSLIFQNNTNNGNSNNQGKIIFVNQNNSGIFNNNNPEKKIIKQYYHINNKNSNKTDYFFKKKKII